MTRVVNPRYAGHPYPGQPLHAVRRDQVYRRVAQRLVADQYRHIVQRVDPHHLRRPHRQPTGQSVHVDPAAFPTRVHVLKHMPRRHQHPGRHLEARPHRHAVGGQHPTEETGHPGIGALSGHGWARDTS